MSVVLSGMIALHRRRQGVARRRSRRRRSSMLRVVPTAVRAKSALGLYYRIFNATEYRFYRRLGEPPGIDAAPFATSSSLPDTPTPTFGDGKWYIAVEYFDGLFRSGFLPIGPAGEPYLILEIESGAQIADRPKAPRHVSLILEAGGVVRVSSIYYETDSSTRAGEWTIDYTTDGSTPDEDSGDVTVSMTSGGLQILSYALPAQSHGTTVKVRVQTRRNDGTVGVPDWVYSADSFVVTATADAEGPSAPHVGDAWRGIEPESL